LSWSCYSFQSLSPSDTLHIYNSYPSVHDTALMPHSPLLTDTQDNNTLHNTPHHCNNPLSSRKLPAIHILRYRLTMNSMKNLSWTSYYLMNWNCSNSMTNYLSWSCYSFQSLSPSDIHHIYNSYPSVHDTALMPHSPLLTDTQDNNTLHNTPHHCNNPLSSRKLPAIHILRYCLTMRNSTMKSYSNCCC